MLDGFLEPGVPPALFWLCAGLAVLIQGISKSGFAGGAGILSLPLMLLVTPPAKVAAMLLPLLILCDMNALYHHWNNKVWRQVLTIYLPSIAGILAGAAVWWYIGQEQVEGYKLPLKRFVGVLAILFALYIVAKETAMTWIARHRPGPRAGVAMGLAAGFTSTIAHAAGPFVGLYLFAQDMGKSLFIGTVAWTFTLINLTKLPFYIAVGLIQRDVLIVGLMLVWLIPIGSFLGKWLSERVSESRFNRVICALTLITGLHLLHIPAVDAWLARLL